LLDASRVRQIFVAAVTGKTRPHFCRCRVLLTVLLPASAFQLSAQQIEADAAWKQSDYSSARHGYEQVLTNDPHAVLANLRLGILLAWDGRLDSALVLIARARSGHSQDTEMALIHARVRSWNKEQEAALAIYDSVLARQPELRDARIGRAQTLAWAGKLKQAASLYGRVIEKDPADRDARLGQAQLSAWSGDLRTAVQRYRSLLEERPRDTDALVGLGYVYYWEGKVGSARREARTALEIDSTHRDARELLHTTEKALRPALEGPAAWSNDSDHNTSFWQTLGVRHPFESGVTVFGSVNALQASDPVLEGSRVGGEGGLSLTMNDFSFTAAAGVRRIVPEAAEARTAATYGSSFRYRPVPLVGFNLGYSRTPFDETAALMERALDMELLEGGVDLRPFRGFSMYASGSGLWLSDGNFRSGLAAGLNQKLNSRLSVGVSGRSLSYEDRGVDYFSPDRFSVLEGTAGYELEPRPWGGSVGLGLGAQQVGGGAAAQTEWHLEGRLARRWGVGNRLELFGLVTNSALSSTTGAFRYRSAGLTVRLGL
jgi:tetratricopeptide (TPR) repeat protein